MTNIIDNNELKVYITSDQNKLYSLKDKMPSVKKRNWQVFHGNSNFYCNGRIMMASQPKVFFLTFMLIFVVGVLYVVNECFYLAKNVSIFVSIIGVLQLICECKNVGYIKSFSYQQFTHTFTSHEFVLLVLTRTAMMDPGIIPLPTQDEIDYTLNIMGIKNYDRNYVHPPYIKEIDINGVKVSIKFCYTCKVFRPPRASHCSVCNVCIDRFDHHCPWVGNCIGKRNYRYFYLFLVSLAITSVYIFSCVIIHIAMLTREITFIEAIKKTPLSFVEGAIIFFSIWSVIGLASFHTYLLVTNQTTNEDIKSSFTSAKSKANPFNEGGILANAASILCKSTIPSLIDRRGFVEEKLISTAIEDVTFVYVVVVTNPHQFKMFYFAIYVKGNINNALYYGSDFNQ